MFLFQYYELEVRVFDGFVEDTYLVNVSLINTNYLPPVFEPLEYDVTGFVEHAPVDSEFLVQVS